MALRDAEENIEGSPELSSLEQYRSITRYLGKCSPTSDLDKSRMIYRSRLKEKFYR